MEKHVAADAERKMFERAPARLYPNWPFDEGVPNGPDRKVQDFVAALRGVIGPDKAFPHQRALAAAAGYNEANVSRVLRGDIQPTARFIAAVEDAVGKGLWPRHDAQAHTARQD